MLSLLSARMHRVHTGVTVHRGTAVDTIVVSTAVTFVALDGATIDWYVGTGEPMDKAGGYAMQGAGGGLRRRAASSRPGDEGWTEIELPYGSGSSLAEELTSYGPDVVVRSPRRSATP